METPPIVNTDQDTKPDFYKDILSKRIRPRAKTEESEMKAEEEKSKKDAGKAALKRYTTPEAI
jgi:hypothetical protein